MIEKLCDCEKCIHMQCEHCVLLCKNACVNACTHRHMCVCIDRYMCECECVCENEHVFLQYVHVYAYMPLSIHRYPCMLVYMHS